MPVELMLNVIVEIIQCGAVSGHRLRVTQNTGPTTVTKSHRLFLWLLSWGHGCGESLRMVSQSSHTTSDSITAPIVHTWVTVIFSCGHGGVVP
jgi:hypothetical protein